MFNRNVNYKIGIIWITHHCYLSSKFETKPDSELFVVDTAGANAVEKIEDGEAPKPLSRKLQKRAKLKEVPKCFEVLLPTSKVYNEVFTIL